MKNVTVNNKEVRILFFSSGLEELLRVKGIKLEYKEIAMLEILKKEIGVYAWGGGINYATYYSENAGELVHNYEFITVDADAIDNLVFQTTCELTAEEVIKVYNALPCADGTILVTK